MRGLHVHSIRVLPVQVTGRLKMREASHCAYSLRQQYSKLLLQYELHMHKTKGAAPSPPAGTATPSAAAAAAAAAPAGSLIKEEASGAAGAAPAAGAGRVGAGSATEVLHTSTNSLSLLLQDIEERIPWEAVGGCSADWADARPDWLEIVVSAGADIRAMAQAVATLESVLDDSALVPAWRPGLRATWMRQLVGAPSPPSLAHPLALTFALTFDLTSILTAILAPTIALALALTLTSPHPRPDPLPCPRPHQVAVATATELKALVLHFEENVKWSTFEGGEAEEAKEKSDSKASRPRKREPQASEPPQDASAAKELPEAAQQRPKKPRSGDVEAAEPKDKVDSPQPPKPRGGGGSAPPAAAAPAGKKETAAEKDERERELRLAAREAAREAQRNKKGGGGGGDDDSPSTREKGEDAAADAKMEDAGKTADEADAGRKREKMEEEEGEEEVVAVKRTRHSVKQETMLQQVMGSGGGSSPRKDPKRGGGAEEEEEEEEEEDDDDDVKLSSVEGLLKAGIAHKNLVFGSAAAKVAGSVSLDGDVPPEKVELKFWRLAQGKDERSSGGGGGGSGARELDTAHLAVAQPGRDGGGGFAAPGEADEEPYASSPWNLRQLLRQRDCLLAHLQEAVPAEQRQLGFGALFGGHAWAVHEHFMYGLSYLHVGAPRTWYGLSGHDAEALQALLVSESSATDAAKCTFQLPALLAPSMLCSHELQVHPSTHPHLPACPPACLPILACLLVGRSILAHFVCLLACRSRACCRGPASLCSRCRALSTPPSRTVSTVWRAPPSPPSIGCRGVRRARRCTASCARRPQCATRRSCCAPCAATRLCAPQSLCASRCSPSRRATRGSSLHSRRLA